MKETLSPLETDSDGRGLLRSDVPADDPTRSQLGVVFLKSLSALPPLPATEKAKSVDSPAIIETEPADMPGKVTFCAKQYLAELQAGANRAEWFNVRLGQPVQKGHDDWIIDLSVKLPGVGSGPLTADDHISKRKLWIKICDGKPSVLAVTQS